MSHYTLCTWFMRDLCYVKKNANGIPFSVEFFPGWLSSDVMLYFRTRLSKPALDRWSAAVDVCHSRQILGKRGTLNFDGKEDGERNNMVIKPRAVFV